MCIAGGDGRRGERLDGRFGTRRRRSVEKPGVSAAPRAGMSQCYLREPWRRTRSSSGGWLYRL